MGTSANKHARQKQSRARIDNARSKVAKTSRRRRALAVIAAAIGVAVIIGGVVLQTGGSGEDDSTSATEDSSTTTTSAGAELPAPPEGVTLTEPTPCPPAGGSAKRVQKFAGPPPMCIDPAASYTATFATTEGSFTAELAAKAAPVTVNNFVVLARYHAYDGVPFHRIIPNFVIQAGDTDGAPWGQNDLGYQFEDELPSAVSDYVDYALVMANAGPATNGSQFFVTLPGGGAQLQLNYSLFGQVTQGTEVVDAIGELGSSGQDGAPTKAVVIDSITITETKP